MSYAREREETRLIWCATTDAVQGDCAPGCEHDCWSDPARIVTIELPSERP